MPVMPSEDDKAWQAKWEIASPGASGGGVIREKEVRSSESEIGCCFELRTPNYELLLPITPF
jgi:hypothetical protein